MREREREREFRSEPRNFLSGIELEEHFVYLPSSKWCQHFWSFFWCSGRFREETTSFAGTCRLYTTAWGQLWCVLARRSPWRAPMNGAINFIDLEKKKYTHICTCASEEKNSQWGDTLNWGARQVRSWNSTFSSYSLHNHLSTTSPRAWRSIIQKLICEVE